LCHVGVGEKVQDQERRLELNPPGAPQLSESCARSFMHF
jgi:hypothetical protein